MNNIKNANHSQKFNDMYYKLFVASKRRRAFNNISSCTIISILGIEKEININDTIFLFLNFFE